MQLCARRYDTGEPVRLEISRGKIASAAPCAAAADSARWPLVAPGLIDIQVHGCGGQEFGAADITVERVAEIAHATAAFGVTRFCPTLTTRHSDVLHRVLRVVAAACESSAAVARRIAGIHLEGPYVSPEDGPRGGHPREYCRPPDWDEFQRFQESAGGRIRILTMSVEFPGAALFVERVARTGVVAAIGHTAADAAQIRAAVDAGARLSTHLGNGLHPLLRRHRNYLWQQLAEDRLAASLIVDGRHLPPAVVKAFVRAKTPERCILIGDLSAAEGASLPIGAGVVNVMHFAGVGLAEAVRMAADHPARLLGIDPGGLAVGDPADLVLFDLAGPADGQSPAQFTVRATLADGEVVFS